MYKNIDLEKLIIYDIETLKNCFVCNCLDYKTKKKKSFVFYNSQNYYNQPLEFLRFLRSCIRNGYTFLGFNVLNFDSQILHEYYDWCSQKRDPLHEFSIDYIITQLYNKAQDLIALQDDKERFKALVPETKLFAPHIDLYKQLHYDRPAKATSLKWVEFTMQYPTIEEMPIEHDEEIKEEDIEKVVNYCWNDVLATTEFFERVKFETDVRLNLSKEYDLNLINCSEPRMVREIFGKFLCEDMKISYKELKDLKTIRTKIPIKNIIFPYTSFQSKPFQEVFEVFKNSIIDATPNQQAQFSHTFLFQGMEVDFGLGGIHACIKSGVYTHNEDEVIEDADGTSFYPFLAIKNGLRPEHLGESYSKVYPMMYAERIKYDKKDPRNYIFKIVLNSAYGLSKEINSYLYDPKYTYAITINGQLSLLMLVEALSMSIPDILFLQMNTDGITYKYNKKYTDKVRKICQWWENTTKINLEYAYYQKMVIMDVNNYLAIKEGFDGTQPLKDYVKKKGLFETEMAYHKNPSFLIIPKALEQYFVNNLTITNYINNTNNSIFDYCGGVKRKSNFKLNLVQNFNGVELITPQQKVCRYFISKQNEISGVLFKDFDDGRRVSVIANTYVAPLDTITLKEASNYSIDYNWYEKETRKIIEQIEPSIKQLTLL